MQVNRIPVGNVQKKDLNMQQRDRNVQKIDQNVQKRNGHPADAAVVVGHVPSSARPQQRGRLGARPSGASSRILQRCKRQFE